MDQAKILAKLSGEERLNQAFKLSDFIRELSLKNIKEQNPKIKPPDLIKKLKKRLYHD